mmetsp:Transcript_66908/g.161546  ORF Transcript_66908/g.161546 Transcript_66908/m.161546 type:complete len:233 (-) Transcript_66908:768-1466(-)
MARHRRPAAAAAAAAAAGDVHAHAPPGVDGRGACAGVDGLAPGLGGLCPPRGRGGVRAARHQGGLAPCVGGLAQGLVRAAAGHAAAAAAAVCQSRVGSSSSSSRPLRPDRRPHGREGRAGRDDGQGRGGGGQVRHRLGAQRRAGGPGDEMPWRGRQAFLLLGAGGHPRVAGSAAGGRRAGLHARGGWQRGRRDPDPRWARVRAHGLRARQREGERELARRPERVPVPVPVRG